MLARLRIESDKETGRTRYFLNGAEISNCLRELNVEYVHNGQVECTLKMFCEVEHVRAGPPEMTRDQILADLQEIKKQLGD